MIKFAICDDDSKYMNSITKIICRAFNEIKTFDEACECVLYNSGDELIEHFVEDEIDIFFLDIECGEQSGFDIAKKLIKYKKDLGIVYVTNYQHYVSEAFVCRPLGFICKSNIENDIKMPMLNIVEFLQDKKQKIVFQSKKGELELFLCDIIVVEVFSRELQITMTDKVIKYPGSLSTYEQLLEEAGFIRITRSVLVNKRFITNIDGNTIYLTNKLKYVISRRKVFEVREMWGRADNL